MMRWNVLWGIARAEARLDRRLVRYWVFVALASLFAAGSYAAIAALYYNFSAHSATIGAMNTRFLFVGGFGFRYALIIAVGLIFLAFDIRARDAKDRIAEVLDSLPYSNLELVAGRCLGLLMANWIPPAILCGAIAAVGWGFGLTIEPWSLLSWLTLQLIPAMVFMAGLTFFLTLVVRNRLVSSILMLVTFGALFFATLRTPIWAAPAADILGGFMAGFPSDIVPTLLTPDGLLQRAAILIAGFGLLVLAAAVHPRKDDGAGLRRGAIGVAMLATSAVMLVLVVQGRTGTLDRIETWRAAHAARVGDPVADVRSVRGTVALDPGRRVDLDLTLEATAPEGVALDTLRFAFNPGFEVAAVDGVDGPLRFTHDDGLLEIALPRTLVHGETSTLRMQASGRPDDDFAYLDAEMHPFSVRAWDGQVFLLGLTPVVFDRNYVALMPGAYWLPRAGTAIGGDGNDGRPVDFFDLDLTVRVPEGWTAVVAGRRQATPEGQRFAPANPVPPVALLASEFVARSEEIDDVVVEALLHRSHAAQFELFEESAGEIHDWLSRKLEDARDVGLEYPLETLSMVETPQELRGFGGGWRMPTTMSQPGAVLIKEAGFPTARLDVPFKDRKKFEDREGGVARAKLEQLERFFANDFTGSNPFVGASQSYFEHQTDGIGPEGLPLDYVFAELTSRLVADAHGYFSVYILDSGMDQVIGQTMQRYFGNRRQLQVVDALIDVVASRPAVWDRLLKESLVDLDPSEDPKESVDILALKCGAMAESMFDELGRESSGRFLSALLDRARGRAFTRDDVLAAGQDVGVDLEPWLATWLEQVALPGFRVPRVDAFRLKDADDGSPRYQTIVTVANEEDIAGLIRVEVLGGEGQGSEWTSEGPVRVAGASAVEVGVVTSKPPSSVQIEPYLSLNRGPFNAGLDGGIDEERSRDDDPFRGARPASWTPLRDERITIDDLDPGFSIAEGEGSTGLRLTGRKKEDVETDGGIPVHGQGRVGRDFVRLGIDSAWGRYRHTVAAARPGDTGQAAVFAAEVDRSGPWRLEIHLPSGSGGKPAFDRSLGTWRVEIEDASGSNTTEIDAGDAAIGWNDLGTFEIASGEVRVRVRGVGSDALVLADAIRWTPPERGGTATGAQR